MHALIEFPIKGELYSAERLEEYAAYLAAHLEISEDPKLTQPLLPRMRENGKNLLSSYRALSEAIHRKETLPAAAEWLTDNFHIVEEQLREIAEDLPPSYYKELPKIAIGELAGYPRIYAIALALIAHTDSQLEPEIIRRFICAFQKVSALSIGELWALAITLRLVLVENLNRISSHILSDHDKRNLANKFADELIAASSNQKKFETVLLKLPSLNCKSLDSDCAYIAQIAKRLRDQEPEIWPALEFLEKQLLLENSSPEKIVHALHHRQAANQVSVANIITSMRLLSSLNWRIFFESVSLVDRILEVDPVYGQMDFATRDRYRHVIETLGNKSGVTETAIAARVSDLASAATIDSPSEIRKSHVGYYLIGEGATQLETHYGCRIKPKFSSFLLSKPNLVYFGLLIIFMTLLCGIPFFYLAFNNASVWALLAVECLLIIPCSDLALSLTNLVLTHSIRPFHLPKLDYSSGIPNGAETIVVIPCMLSNTGVIDGLLEKIEIHYLGNADPNLFFALLSDFEDASSATVPQDEAYLARAVAGISRLNRKYVPNSPDRFHIFHRARQWNASESRWIGWERKRGKIQEFNSLLRGIKKTSFTTATAPLDFLNTIQFVITLDSDSQLPRDAAKKMVGTIMHPLNQPYFDKVLRRVTEGYAILQPRIGISLESSTQSLFARTFSGYVGIDPYTTAVSESYHDLFHEGSYTGKGLYAVDAFEAATADRVPENTVLSHDLIEGLYARTALLTDVELLDDYPQSYRTFFTRQHRWTRGDWQIAAWILPWVKDAEGKWIKNSIPLISRWKIFDNLRRSLVAPFILLWIILGWTVLPGSAVLWTIYSLLVIIFPCLVQALLGAPKTNIMQALFYCVFLAHQAYIQTDAIFRVFFRKLISKKKLLEWTTAAKAEKENSGNALTHWQSPWLPEFILLGLAGVLAFVIRPAELTFALAFIVLWMSYPLFSFLISKKFLKKEKCLNLNETLLMRQIARRTWNYFESFTSAENNWLPPDNHQEAPFPVTAHRTSPTNIGLYLLSLSAARDFGFISPARFIHLTNCTLKTLEKMEQYEGHYLNWYDTKTLQPLYPRYVSTVDSGNLAGYFLAARQTCLGIRQASLIEPQILAGLSDTIHIIQREMKTNGITTGPTTTLLQHCKRLLAGPAVDNFSDWYKFTSDFIQLLEKLKDNYPTVNKKSETTYRWLNSCLNQMQSLQSDIEIVAPWLWDSNLRNYFASASGQVHLKSLDRNNSLAELASNFKVAIVKIKQQADGFAIAGPLEKAMDFIDGLLNDAQNSAEFMDQKFNEMNFTFLLNKDREVFSIGYNVSARIFDNGLYDLLGSESRLASFIAIAKGDVPQVHWFRLGRQLVPACCGRALVSWSASIFEYLMPLLVLRDYENTLLSETTHSVVMEQINYGKKLRIPWGVSEAGYNARDLQLNYQYGPFGIPGLGLKRGLSQDIVISPYSSFLAAMVKPCAAFKNIKRLIKNKLLTEYGFYEAVDYTPERVPEHQKYAVIRSFMAHHQGMTLVAINNVLHDNITQNRFHMDPRVRATHLLLQERIPKGVEPVPPKAAEIELETGSKPSPNPYIRQFSHPDSAAPRIQLLSNQNYSVMISTAGSGYSKCRELAVTRWREDATRDNWGSYVFVRDQKNKTCWSTTYQPLLQVPSSYKASFYEDKVEFRRRDGEISSYTQILVAPEDDVEIRHVTLTNHSDEARVFEMTSYLEPVLSSPAGDLDHMAFSKLFLQTEFLPSKMALLATRRKRSALDKESWGIHVVVTDAELVSEIQYETDRTRFMGRGHDLTNPIALSEGAKLSNTSGPSLDPIFSIRIKIKIPAKGKARTAFTTGWAGSRDVALTLADRYHDIHSFERESNMAWTKSQADLRHFNIDAEAAYLYQHLAERILYSDVSLRPPAHQRAANTFEQSSLWPNGISGDLPIVVIRIGSQKDVGAIRQLLRCHEYLRLKGLVYDFIILNEDSTSYFQGLQEEIQQQIRSTGSQGWLNKNGGIFILRRDITPAKDIAHILAIARVSLSADEPLKEQVNRKSAEKEYPPQLNFTSPKIKYPVPPVPQLELDFYNGFGGFSKEGHEYVIVLKAQEWTPAPWINVIGNSRGFGFQISESGAGFTWSVNSQTNRLTPWSNDPVSDPPGEIIYLRDDETGEIWTPTPLPIRSEAPYVIRHGQAYSSFEHTDHGFEHNLTLFVPKEDDVKISLLKIKNISGKTRKLSITSYTEWVLGARRDKTAAFLVCDVDPESSIIFARNPHDNEFAKRVAFSDFSSIDRTFTCSRKEFIGRNGNPARPRALSRNGLSQKLGTGQDPCAVLQTSIELRAGEEFEIAVLLGQAENIESSREICIHYRELAHVKMALAEVKTFWKTLINVVQVNTPEPSMNILMNQWLFYQTLSCRYWSRTAFYQSGGAYGFRDQLQDSMALIYSAPDLTLEQILRAAGRQFPEGDVQHWWHPPKGRGIRTRMTDDLLWLPFVVSFYIRITGDKDILNEVIPFLEAPLLKAEEEDSYSLPAISNEKATLLEHCLRAMEYSLKLGPHGLPLIGTGDWNDGMNRVGSEGKGESVWLGWFLYKVLEDFLPHCDQPEQSQAKEKFQIYMQKLKSSLEQEAWDGDWYKRAFFDDGTPLGSKTNEECRIDSIAQSWSVLSGAADPTRMHQAMKSVSENLIVDASKLILLLTPPFDKTSHDPGYIKGYIPGVRENGGQYTHAAVWVVMAFAQLGDGDTALKLFNMLNPILHSKDPIEADTYKIEPFVLAGDVYGGKTYEGRGGWSWYTGSASWYYRAGLESLLGFKLRGDKLRICPCVPASWKEFDIVYIYGKSKYSIKISNPESVKCSGEVLLSLDGKTAATELTLVDDGIHHTVLGVIW